MGGGDDPILSIHLASNKRSTQVADFVILNTASSSQISVHNGISWMAC